MLKKIICLSCIILSLGACSFKAVKEGETPFSSVAKAQNFAQVSSVFKIELDDKLGTGSSLLLFIDYDGFEYKIKVLGAFASVLLKAGYNLKDFTYDFEPEILQNKQVKELFEQTISVLVSQNYADKYNCTHNNCTLELGTTMFKNKYIFSSYNQAGFAQDILCSYRRGTVKINLQLLKVK